jgi:hypothetical protein
VATYVYDSSQGQRTHSTRTKVDNLEKVEKDEEIQKVIEKIKDLEKLEPIHSVIESLDK